MSSFNATDLEGKCFWAQIASETLELRKARLELKGFYFEKKQTKRNKKSANVCISKLGEVPDSRLMDENSKRCINAT